MQRRPRAWWRLLNGNDGSSHVLNNPGSDTGENGRSRGRAGVRRSNPTAAIRNPAAASAAHHRRRLVARTLSGPANAASRSAIDGYLLSGSRLRPRSITGVIHGGGGSMLGFV